MKNKIKLHFGCGYNKLNGFVNIDKDEKCNPDMVLDMDKKEDWQRIQTHSVDYIKAHFVLEHVDYKLFFEECYRILKKKGILNIRVPCGLDFTAFQDPTHIKYYMPNSIQHLTNYEHEHYNSNNYNNWNFKHVETKLLFRSELSKLLYYFFRMFGLGGKITNLDNIAYLFVWGVEWIIKKK